MDLREGEQAPEFSLPSSQGEIISLNRFRGRKVVLYFYPRDNTPGCTLEAKEFRDMYEALKEKGAEVIGISRDSSKSHQNFAAKNELPFVLLSDEDGAVCEAYGVIKEKNMYGKKVMGIERSTFILDETGIIRKVFRKVKAAGHAAAVVALI